MSEFRIERGYRELYISDGDSSRISPRSQSPTGSQTSTRGPASAGVPQYKMGPPTYRSGVYVERDNTRPPRPAPTFNRSTDPSGYPGAHRSQVTYHVQDSFGQNRESPSPPPYSPPRHGNRAHYMGSGEVGGPPSRMYAAVYKTENAAVPSDQSDYQQHSPQSPSAYQERKDIETLVPMYTAAYPPNDKYVPAGAPSKIVYSMYKTPQGHVIAQQKGNVSPGAEVPSGSPQSPNVQPGSLYKQQQTSPQYRPNQRPDNTKAGSPRPYQLRPTMDLYPTSPTTPESPAGPAKEAEVDALTDLLIQNMEVSGDPDFFGMCVKCGRAIMGDNQGCSALDQLFHIECFSCSSCGLCLKGKQFFAMEGKPYCEPCYMNTLEKCTVCSKPITDRILRATGKPYHPQCFVCVVCGKNLDGVQFTVDATNQIHCIKDFHKKFAPRCCVCDGPIMPETGEEETVRIVAMDRSFHVKCYKCEDCGLQLSSEADGRGCYPLDDHILCKSCNAKRIQSMTTRMMTEL